MDKIKVVCFFLKKHLPRLNGLSFFLCEKVTTSILIFFDAIFAKILRFQYQYQNKTSLMPFVKEYKLFFFLATLVVFL